MRRIRGLRRAADAGIVLGVLAVSALWIACVLLIAPLR